MAWKTFRKRFLQLRASTYQFDAVESTRKVVENRMSNDITYMDCWGFIAPLIPVDTDFTMDIYIMVFGALKEAEKKRIAGGGKTGGQNDADQH